MSDNVHVLHPQSVPIAGFLRVGHTGHRKLEALLAEGRFPYKRVVFDAAHISKQKDLVASLRNAGCEVILDPNFAEMATDGRYQSAVGKLPWANPERPWVVSDFSVNRNLDVAKQIADFAVEQGVNVVLAPTLVSEHSDNALHRVNLEMCAALRRELDSSGGSNIAIDYQMITTNALLKDVNGRSSLVAGLRDIPFENLWLRISGFGANASPLGTRRMIEAVRELHDLEIPLVADYVGGFSGLAMGAYGAVSGISHGIGQHEQFNFSSWKAAPKEPSEGDGRGFGSAKRIYLHELDRSFTENQLTALFAARGCRSRFGCHEKGCCQDGVGDMVENHKAHFINQRRKQINELSSVPALRREEHFIMKMIDPAVRSARYGANVKISDEKTAKAVKKARDRLICLRDTLVDLHDTNSAASRSKSLSFRGSGRPVSAASGWK